MCRGDRKRLLDNVVAGDVGLGHCLDNLDVIVTRFCLFLLDFKFVLLHECKASTNTSRSRNSLNNDL